MSRRLTGWLIGIVIGLTVTTAQARTSVWYVTNGSTELFLAGTVHLLSDADFPLPCEFDTAYRRAEKLVFEADLREASSQEFANRYAPRMLYPTSKPLTARLKKKTRLALKRWLRRNGLPEQPYIHMKPGVLMSSLTARQLARIGVTPGGVDQHYMDRARQDKLPVDFLETADSQMELIIGMGVGQEDAYIQHLLHSMSQLQQMFNDMLRSWRSGDIAGLAAASDVAEMRKRHPAIFEQLLTVRNEAWMAQIHDMMQTDEVEYVLVGALHMATEIGLLTRLRESGYSVEPVLGCT